MICFITAEVSLSKNGGDKEKQTIYKLGSYKKPFKTNQLF